MPYFVPKDPPRDPDQCPEWLFETIKRLNANMSRNTQQVAAVGRGESPDGSGNPLIDLSKFFYKPGIAGGQLAFGGTNSGDPLTLSSTAASTKGFIYLGTGITRAAFDESNAFFGVGTDAPTARLHAHLLSTGTSGVNQVGTHFGEYSVVVGGLTKNILALAAYANNSSSFDVAFLSGGSNPVSGTGSIYFTDGNTTGANGTGMRLAYGTFGGDTVQYTHLQIGGLNTDGTSKNRNLLLLGFNDNCGSQFTTHAIHSDIQAEGSNLTGSAISGRSTTPTNMCLVGINSPSFARLGVTNADDQPVVVIGGGAWFQSYHSLALRLTTGFAYNSYNTDTAIAKRDVFQIKAGATGVATNAGALADGTNTAFSVDFWGRLCLFNPGNGALTSRISGRRSDFLLEDSASGASVPVEHFELANTNAFSDGAAQGAYQLRLGFAQVSSVRWALIGANVVGGGNVQPALLDRLGVRTSAFYVSDGSYALAGDVGAPLGLMNIFNFVANGTILLALKRKSGQTGDLIDMFESDGTTKLSFFDKDGKYATNPLPTVGNIATDTNVAVDDAGNVITADGNLVLA